MKWKRKAVILALALGVLPLLALTVELLAYNGVCFGRFIIPQSYEEPRCSRILAKTRPIRLWNEFRAAVESGEQPNVLPEAMKTLKLWYRPDSESEALRRFAALPLNNENNWHSYIRDLRPSRYVGDDYLTYLWGYYIEDCLFGMHVDDENPRTCVTRGCEEDGEFVVWLECEQYAIFKSECGMPVLVLVSGLP